MYSIFINILVTCFWSIVLKPVNMFVWLITYKKNVRNNIYIYTFLYRDSIIMDEQSFIGFFPNRDVDLLRATPSPLLLFIQFINSLIPQACQGVRRRTRRGIKTGP